MSAAARERGRLDEIERVRRNVDEIQTRAEAAAKGRFTSAQQLERLGKPKAAAAFYRALVQDYPTTSLVDRAAARADRLDPLARKTVRPLVRPDLKANAYPVTRVVDGDTIVIVMDGQDVTVRLIGVDTPEVVDPRKPVERFGREASGFTASLLSGQSVRLLYDQGPQHRDRFGRTLAFVFRARDNLFVNREIIRQGFGHAYLEFPFRQDLMLDFRAAEREARESERGLWKPEISK